MDPAPSPGGGPPDQSDARPAQRESVATKPDTGISRRVRVGPKKKADLGALGNLGHVLAHFTQGGGGAICNHTAAQNAFSPLVIFKPQL